MIKDRAVWLVRNSSSGSNSPKAVEALLGHFKTCGIEIGQQTSFPDDRLPSPPDLNAAGIDTVAVFAGDGTVNACVTGLYGWGGKIIVLPGGTKNLLAKRLHGEVPVDVILKRVGSGACRPVRPLVARCAKGDALAGLLVGPGTAWYDVREALRDVDIGRFAGSATSALAESTGTTRVICGDPPLGDPSGYALIEVTPGAWGLQLDGFKVETPGEYLRQALALVKFNFRDGPSDRLGLVDTVRVRDSDDSALGILIDGEQTEGGAIEEITVATCEVDLLATANGF